jgi:hypothetical protein
MVREALYRAQRTALVLAACIIATSVTLSDAEAFVLYPEFGGGFSLHYSASDYFSTPLSATSAWSAAANAGLFFGLSDGSHPVEIQFGATALLTTGFDNNLFNMTLVPFPVMRIQITKVYLGFGVTPFAWRRSDASLGILGFAPAPITLGYLAQAGFLLAGTPKFSAAAQVSAQFFSTQAGAAFSPAPAVDASLVLRMYFQLFSSSSGQGSSGPASGHIPNEYRGWRYPFGEQKN